MLFYLIQGRFQLLYDSFWCTFNTNMYFIIINFLLIHIYQYF